MTSTSQTIDNQSAKLPTSQEAVLSWLDAAMQKVRSSSWRPLLQYDGVDLIESLITPMFLAVMAASRQVGASPLPLKNRVIKIQLRQRLFEIKSRILQRRAIRHNAKPIPKDVILWPRDRTHVLNFIPVAYALAKRGAKTRIVTCQPQMSGLVRNHGLDPYFLPTLWESEFNAVYGQIDRIKHSLAERDDFPIQSEPGIIDGRPDALRRAILDGVENAVLSVVNARRMIRAFGPRLIIVGNDVTTEGRVGSMICQENNVPVVTLMHGLASGSPLNGRHVVDRMLAFGERGVAAISGFGFSAERLAIGGAPYLDERPEQQRVPATQIGRLCGVRPGQKYFLVLTSGPGHSVSLGHHLECVRNIMKLSAGFPAAAFVAKLHPKDDVAYYEQLQREITNSQLQVIPHGTPGYPTDIFQWMQGASAVITCASNCATEAMLMDVPVITVDFQNEIRGVDYILEGATRHARTFEELSGAAQEIIAGTAMPQAQAAAISNYLNTNFAFLDRTATERTVDILLDLAKLPVRISRGDNRVYRSVN